MYGRDEIVLATYTLFLILEDFTELLLGVDPILVSALYALLGNLETGHFAWPVYCL